MKLNELVCPACGLKCMVAASFTVCDACGAHFTAAQSRSRDCPEPYQAPSTITWPTITPSPIPSWPVPYIGDPPPGQQPYIGDPYPIWIAPFGPPGSPFGPTVICEGGTGQASSSLQVMN